MGMSEKRTKSDKALRQADRVEKRTEARPEQNPKKRKPREDVQPSRCPDRARSDGKTLIG